MTKSELMTNDEALTLPVCVWLLRPSSIATSLRSGVARLGHFDRVKRALEFPFRQNVFLPGNFTNGASGLRAFFRNFSGAIVTDLWSETGHHRHGKLDQFFAALFVGG